MRHYTPLSSMEEAATWVPITVWRDLSLLGFFSWAVLPRGKLRLSYSTHQGKGLKEDG